MVIFDQLKWHNVLRWGGLNYWYFGYNGTAFILFKDDAPTMHFPSAMPVNQWVHVAVVVNLYNATVYTNGVALTPLPTGSPSTVAPDNTLLFGNSQVDYTYGYVDECAYFTNCLTQPEIASIYYAGNNSLNIGMAVIYTNSNFTINASGISLPTGHSFIGDGGGLTNLSNTATNALDIPLTYIPAGSIPGTNCWVNLGPYTNALRVSFSITLTNNVYFLITNCPPEFAFKIHEYENVSGGWTRDYPSSITFGAMGGSYTPVLNSPSAGNIDIICAGESTFIVGTITNSSFQ